MTFTPYCDWHDKDTDTWGIPSALVMFSVYGVLYGTGFQIDLTLCGCGVAITFGKFPHEDD